MQKELLQKLGEETIYSAKGHFKACDLRDTLIPKLISGEFKINAI